ncbi:MAG: Kae1-associated serine/threonine protein kinase [Candidatus Diapherotrites archaeon]|uniref:non-specific serine/threonine protein kinase n=1 Tax=Candidatus Iainarchaeum sp. TaxID=3101447 RepID=A0A938YNV6_9ARCH|nr:Kae1-associated serine/threonine protein kinase [Candidatus Diapherotrites archaeon]
MELIRQGAEAKLFKTKHGEKAALLKQRVEKDYRCKELDERLRRERTALESNLLRKARGVGVNTPQVYSVDKGKKEILMKFIEGPRLKDVLEKGNLDLCREIGKAIAIMHGSNIIHGDLTTSNIMLQGEDLFFIDFGLGKSSRKIEDKAVDLLVFKKTFEATHCSLMPKGWEKIIEGYLEGNGEREVTAQMKRVEERVRYH